MGLLHSKHPWGKIRGVIRITGERAKKQFGFTTKPGAEGLLFREYNYITHGGVRKKGIFINNFVPGIQPHTPAQTTYWTGKFKVLANAIHSNGTVLKYIWQKLAEARHPKVAQWDPEFLKINIPRVGTPPDFSKMLISDGRLEPTPQITSIAYFGATNELIINFDSSTYQNGKPGDIVWGAIFIKSAKRLEIPRSTKAWKRCDTTWHGYTQNIYAIGDLIGFVFFNDGNNCSPSVSF